MLNSSSSSPLTKVQKDNGIVKVIKCRSDVTDDGYAACPNVAEA